MPHELAAVRNVIAANMSVRRADMIAVGGLRQEFSRIQKNAAGGEETDLCIRLRASRPGAVVLYDPDAGVEHLVPTERGELRYFIGRCFAEGRSKRTLAAMVGADDGLSSERSYVRRTLPLGVAANLGRLLRGDLAGAGRAGAIVLGLSTTVVGYLSVSAKADPAAPAAGDGRLRVLTATPRSPLVQGGVERHVMEVTRRVAAAGVDTEVLCTEPGGSAVREEERDGVKITTLPSYPADRDWCVSPRLWGEMKRRRGDVVHVQSYHTFVAPAAMLRALVLGIPYVVTFHGGGHSSGLRNRLRVSQRRVLRPLLARAAALVAVAKFEIDQYSRELRLPPERFTFIPNGTELAFSDRSAPIECNGAPVIATVGRLERYKGHHRVIAAFPELLALEPEATLLVVGSGPYEQELRRLAAAAEPNGGERIKFTSVPADRPEEMAKLMRGVSVMVLMSEFETHPLVALEGAAAGCRLLVAGVGGLGELAEDGLARAVPLEEDPAGLARAIAEELELPPPTEVPKLASWDDCAAALLDLYREIAVPQQTSKSA
jgi:glycosyltransferase involved in cell wall biosynthesis